MSDFVYMVTAPREPMDEETVQANVEQRRRVALRVAAAAEDREDCRTLLEQLGLLDSVQRRPVVSG